MNQGDKFNFDDWELELIKLQNELKKHPFVCWRKSDSFFPQHWQPVNFLDSNKIGKFVIGLN